jgi:hypothetical protein
VVFQAVVGAEMIRPVVMLLAFARRRLIWCAIQQNFRAVGNEPDPLASDKPRSTRRGARLGAGKNPTRLRPQTAGLAAGQRARSAELRRIFAAPRHGPVVIAELLKLARTGSPDLVRVAACRKRLDRGYGRSLNPTPDQSRPAVTVNIVQFSDPDDEQPVQRIIKG